MAQTNAELFIERYLGETADLPTLTSYLTTIPPRKLKSDKQLVSVITRVVLRGMLSDIPYPTMSTFSVVSDFSETVVSAQVIMDDEGTTEDVVVKLPQYITVLTTAPDEQAAYMKFAVAVIDAISKELE